MTIMYSAKDIEVGVHASTREEAIKKGVEVLIHAGKVTENYVLEIFEVLEEYGPYFVLAPGIAFPHSKPSESVKQSGISLITLNQPVEFGSEANDPVSIVCTIASIDSQDHLLLLRKMAGFLSDSENIKFLHRASSQDIDEIVEKLNNIPD